MPQQLSLRDHPIPVADEIGEHREDLRLHGPHLTRNTQLVARNVELVRSEPEPHCDALPFTRLVWAGEPHDA